MTLSMEAQDPSLVLNRGVHSGFDWVVLHNGMGYRCGYVNISVGHPWHGKDYDDVDANIHGGLTFQQAGTDESEWWLGFDCAHGEDAPDPSLPAKSRYPFTWGHGEIRTQEYVENECRQLCEQAAITN